MLGGLLAPPYVNRFSGGSSGQEASSSASFDYSGLENHLKAQDAVDALRGQKFQALYDGDIAGSVTAGDRIRSLLGTINANAPGATERNPHTLADPLSKVTSMSGHVSNRQDYPDFSGHHPHEVDDDAAPAAPQQPQMPLSKQKLITANENAKRAHAAPGWGM